MLALTLVAVHVFQLNYYETGVSVSDIDFSNCEEMGIDFLWKFSKFEENFRKNHIFAALQTLKPRPKIEDSGKIEI